jgi:phospho-N-acetylmuramoyl-pentapeptide-transferase
MVEIFLIFFGISLFELVELFFTALIFGFVFGRPLINVLRRKQGKGQPIRDDGPEAHSAKSGTPTMGGLLILSALVFSTVMWARLDNNYVIIVLFVTICFGGIGFIDDYLKVSRQNPKGVSSKIRLLSGFFCGSSSRLLNFGNSSRSIAKSVSIANF